MHIGCCVIICSFVENYNITFMKHYRFVCIALFLIVGCSSPDTLKSYTDAAFSVNERVELLLKEMTIEEKVGQLCLYVGEPSCNTSNNKDEFVSYELSIGECADLIRKGKISSFLKVPTYNQANALQRISEQSRLKIPLLIATDAMHGHGMYATGATIYPSQIGIASTFDTTIAYYVARYTAREMRATGYQWTFSPNVEVVRDCRWGRIGETFGEDPLLISKMGSAMIRAYQGSDFSDSTAVLACAKHFVAGGIAYNGLNGAPADISERTLHEVFFPPFIDAVDAGVYTLMPAHNELNGVPCHAHREFLQSLLHDSWGFDGIVVSDWNDIEKLSSVHKIVSNAEQASVLAFDAGVNMHMHGPGFFKHITDAVKKGAVSEIDLDDAVRKVLNAKFAMGLFENRYVDSGSVQNILLHQKHRAQALRAARKSIVLLENKDSILPLTGKQKILVTGPLADHQGIMGDWVKYQPDSNIVTVLEGIHNEAPVGTDVTHYSISDIKNIADDDILKVKAEAQKNDIVIAVIGDNSNRFGGNKTTGENLDRATLLPSGDQPKLVQALVESGTPVVVVLVNGGPIAWEWMSKNVEGLIEAWEPGMMGGQAIAEIIYGKYCPGGRLPITFPRTVGHNQSFYNHKPSIYHRGHFFGVDVTPLYEFGYGLSYTSFEYSNLQVPDTISSTDDVKVKVSVENIGNYSGDEVVLVYLNDKVSSVTTPVKKLVDFKRITLTASQDTVLEFTIANKYLSLLDINMKKVVEPGNFELIIGNDVMTKEFLVK